MWGLYVTDKCHRHLFRRGDFLYSHIQSIEVLGSPIYRLEVDIETYEKHRNVRKVVGTKREIAKCRDAKDAGYTMSLAWVRYRESQLLVTA